MGQPTSAGLARLYEGLFEHSPDGVILSRPDRTLIRINPAACRALGGTEEALIGRGREALVVEEPGLERLREARARGSPVQGLIQLRRSDGTVFPAEATSAEVPGPEPYVVTIFRDVSERERSRAAGAEALRLAEQRLGLAVQAGHIGLWDLDLLTDTSWRSPEHDLIFGYAVPPAAWGYRRFLEHVVPADVPAVEAAFARAREGGRLSFECRIRPASGPERWIEVEGECFRDAAGLPTRMAGVVLDVTARKTSEAALQRSEARFRALIEGSSDFTLVLDERGTITFASPASREVLGIPPAEVEGDSAFASVHPDDRPKVQEAFAAILADPQSRRRVTFRVRRSSGEVTLLEAEPRNLLHVPGVRGIVVNSRNITAQHRLQEQLQQAQKLDSVGQLAGGVAHDFNNLLGVILGYAGSALGELGPTDPLREDLQEIAAAARRGAALTRQLLAFGRRQVLQPVVHAPNEVVRDLERMLRRLLSEDLVLVVRLAEDAGEVLADPSQVEQVVMNLVLNARDAMTAGGTVTIETAAREVPAAAAPAGVAPGRYLLLSVQDTGCGMDAATLARIYEPFFTTKAPGKGTGLGLATVYGIVRQSGGFLEVESEPGRGTTFRVYFPRASSAATWKAPVQPGAGGQPGQGTILLVEDDDALRQHTARTLARAGYQVLVAAEGQGALRQAGAHAGALDLLLTDVVLPGLSGPQLARALAAARPSVRVLFVSGHVDQALGPQDLGGPGRSFLAKPFGPGELLARVREVLGAPAAPAP